MVSEATLGGRAGPLFVRADESAWPGSRTGTESAHRGTLRRSLAGARRSSNAGAERLCPDPALFAGRPISVSSSWARCRSCRTPAGRCGSKTSWVSVSERNRSQDRNTNPIQVSGDGRLSGDLIRVGSGDPTLGGRTNAAGDLDVPDFDHYDANAVPGMAALAPEDPRVGIDDLARQVAASGIRRIDDDVIIDNRLWDPVSIGGTPITPTVVNDNLIDVPITPNAPREQATLDWRPKTAAFTVDARVTTTAAGTAPAVRTDSTSPGHIRVRGSVPADATAPFAATYYIPDPAAFARTVLRQPTHRRPSRNTQS
ncbi:D-alanyl-D-alanine carboxypeptidase [Streptomyces sp. NPDC048295]|uniref:D-alanyl-D-alanine carboxypeptidase n=1 Tax=Streptomyces sp. NPDC048295 TaxID=3154617 RepID=UPI003425A6C8